MEVLKNSIPSSLMNLIISTPHSNLSHSCAALIMHFNSYPLFQQHLDQLVNPWQATCAKDVATAAEFKREGNAAFSNSNYELALSSYTKALRFAPFAAKEEKKVLLATILVNRAATLHKVELLKSALRDCDRAIELLPSYSKAWYRRGRIKYDLQDFQGACEDMGKALSCESSQSGQMQVKRELALMEEKVRSVCAPESKERNSSFKNAVLQATENTLMGLEKLELGAQVYKHRTDKKQMELRTREALQSGSLVFQEEAYTAIVLKRYRDTHCHFCFELLPADPVACDGCAIPLYCSNICKVNAVGGYQTERSGSGGCQLEEGVGFTGSPATTITDISHGRSFESEVEQNTCSQGWGEHAHECGGCSWSAVLPVEAALAARMLARGVHEAQRSYEKHCKLVGTLCNHYGSLSTKDKLELHVLGVVVAHCVQFPPTPMLEGGIEVVAEVAAELILNIAQIRVNAMAIFTMFSPDSDHNLANSSYSESGSSAASSTMTNMIFCSVDQIKVAQGIFSIGSSLNHSCTPNVHASFLLRRLSIRAVADVGAGSPLELCYGPQVGQMTQVERKKMLLERYYFTCTCPACSTITLPDLYLRSFRCAKPGCMGVVLGPGSLDLNLPIPRLLACRPFIQVTGREKKAENCVQCPLVRWYDTCGLNCEKYCSHSRHLKREEGSGGNSCDFKFVLDGSSTSDFPEVFAGEEKIGHCLFCGTTVDIDRADEIARIAVSHLERVESALLEVERPEGNLRGEMNSALGALEELRVVVHACNVQLAKGEDIVGRLLCALDQPNEGFSHCETSILILEQLYQKHHIVLGSEYLKLASIALMGSNFDCARSLLASVDYIFRVHYGINYHNFFPYVTELDRLVQKK